MLMACLPVDTSNWPDIGMEIPKPTDLYVKGVCENLYCGQEIWVGPRQAAALRLAKHAGETVYVLCYLCAMAAQVQMGGDPNDIQHLGGGYTVEGQVRE